MRYYPVSEEMLDYVIALLQASSAYDDERAAMAEEIERLMDDERLERG